jgi:hypothetical protein
MVLYRLFRKILEPPRCQSISLVPKLFSRLASGFVDDLKHIAFEAHLMQFSGVLQLESHSCLPRFCVRRRIIEGDIVRLIIVLFGPSVGFSAFTMPQAHIEMSGSLPGAFCPIGSEGLRD